MKLLLQLQKLWAQLNGYKTYVVAVVTCLYALIYYGLDQHDWATAVSLLLGASGLGALRHAQPAKR